ncbi:hypothetical protein O6H91_02G072400 [Diphasiastrum complanatum]|uniref:Uncharacterized protein n=5 Tax=Diphasiastrum complanatum TaxID=34168 RepID=A0ACC2EGM5_DIPCM|nr:hypothetical protein O6H91_02G072400 [Diphasiastrum complanatum]KAJ7565720.1 hypothetical protein O6H91_02G072400 [Diphasiastrum complanatum]KAJ7565721.1 hypothetical protein O6H91_02G072400 [Diphasiastrum complanatum]KAJ7565723.1 hypothetical protein O6H91_02G072400 [Diphasiastrum complanatum]KAJ7565724.1 hypothetical protein O6H91_02G072400 [Diphasiastrum complanatum]
MKSACSMGRREILASNHVCCSGKRMSLANADGLRTFSNTQDVCIDCQRMHSSLNHEQSLPCSLESGGVSSSTHSHRQIYMSGPLDPTRKWIFGSVLDPRRRAIQDWNRTFLLSRAFGLAVDPLFLYLMALSREQLCLYVDGWFAVLVTILRCVIDVMHMWHIWVQLKLAFLCKESLVVGRGKLVWDARKVALNYVRSRGGFWFDIFTILPVLQITLWVFVPIMIRRGGQTTAIMTFVLLVFLFQFIPKVFHSVLLVRRMQHVTGYVFGTAWWGFALNLIAYFIAAHVAGACWYLLALQRVESCLHKHCEGTLGCDTKSLGCPAPLLYGSQFADNVARLSSLAEGSGLTSVCLQAGRGNFGYGIFAWAVPLVTTRNWLERILYPMFWGLMTLSSFGNALTPSNHMLEVVFAITVITCGLLLFTMLIGNIQVFLHSITAKNEEMHLKMRDLEWWMRRRQLPSRLRHRVRQYERQKWAALRGVNENLMIGDLPDGLRRDIKHHLCLDLVRQVPLFDQMDEIVLDTICDRVKPLLFIKGETVIRVGDPVLRMLFIVRGHWQSVHRVSNSQTSVFILGPGNFCGDELLSWCLRKPFVDRLPPSTATLTCLDSGEAFGLEAQDLKYVTDHFRYKFANEKLKRTARYYSSGWRTWAAVTIQLAWRRFKAQKAVHALACSSTNVNVPDDAITRNPALATSQNDRLRMYTAMFLSPKPQDHLE